MQSDMKECRSCEEPLPNPGPDLCFLCAQDLEDVNEYIADCERDRIQQDREKAE